MKKFKFLSIATIAAAALSLSACDNLTDAEEACTYEKRKAGVDASTCLRSMQAHEREMARIENRVGYGNQSQGGYGGGGYDQNMGGGYNDNYQEPMHFYGQNGQNYGETGFDSGDMLLSAMGGALLGGYVTHKINGRTMIKDKKGNIISPNEYSKRVQQSDNQKLKNAMNKREEHRRNTNPKVKADRKKEMAQRKAKVEKAKADRLAKQKNGQSKFAKMNQVEKNAANKNKPAQTKQQRIAELKAKRDANNAKRKPVQKKPVYKPLPKKQKPRFSKPSRKSKGRR